MPQPLTDVQRETLRNVCDTVVPSIAHDPDPHGHWARKASDVGTDQALLQVLDQMPDDQSAGMAQLLDVLAEQGFDSASQLSREQLLTNIALSGPDGAAGVGGLQALTVFFAYGMPVDPQTGQNPNWATFGYPGPVSAPPQEPKPITPRVPEGDTTLEADVVIVGSGAGGGTIAGTLAAQGLKVVVLEAGGYLNESDFLQLEIPAYQQSYWRGGPTPTADMNVSLQAGFGLGGGTTINWTNCLRTTDWVREEWATRFGLEGVDGSDYDRHLDTVLARAGATDACSELNGPQRRMQRGAQELGWHFVSCVRNTDPARYDPATAGYIGFGDQSGSKLSIDKTFLRDAVEAGAEVLVRTWAERVLVEGGRAAGVAAHFADPVTGASAQVTVRAPRVVVACGALESPALLLRSQIGGPAVGEHLRLHPCTAVFGTYDEDLQAWWGAPHAGLVHEFENVEDGHGFLIEGAQYAPALGASAVPAGDPRAHKQLMADWKLGATFIGLVRDHGGGRVTIDQAGQAVPWYSLTDDELDVRNTRRALEAQIRLHHAAGARAIYSLASTLPRWRAGDDLEAFIARCRRQPLRAGGQRLFAAHQMGTCRMGADPATSVANPWGELHDTPGVWIGDGSAFPTASGTNPMVSIMALAHRTAEAMTSTTEPAPAVAAAHS